MMQFHSIKFEAEALASEIESASVTRRLALQPHFDKVLTDWARTGEVVPGHLKRLHNDLIDEVIESRFDNMPV